MGEDGNETVVVDPLKIFLKTAERDRPWITFCSILDNMVVHKDV